MNDQPNETWVDACQIGDIEPEDVIRFDHAGRTFAIYRTKENSYHATDGLCTHANVHLVGGFVMDHLIECPKHNGRFDFTTGKAQGAPACINLNTYPVKVEGDRVLVRIG